MFAVAKIAIYVLEGLFAAGIIGSALVVFLTSVEDFEVFFSRDAKSPSAGEPESALHEGHES